MPTFDIVCRYEIHEIENSVNMVKRDILNRYDFKGSSTSIILDKKNATIKIESNSELQLESVRDMLEEVMMYTYVDKDNFKQEKVYKLYQLTNTYNTYIYKFILSLYHIIIIFYSVTVYFYAVSRPHCMNQVLKNLI